MNGYNAPHMESINRKKARFHNSSNSTKIPRNGCGVLEINGYGAFSLTAQWVFLGMFRLRSTWVCLLMALNAACSVPSSTERLRADLEAMTAEAPGRFAVVFEDLSDPANRVAIREGGLPCRKHHENARDGRTLATGGRRRTLARRQRTGQK